MFKWAEIGFINNRPRYEELSRFMSENGFENSVEFIQVTNENYEQSINEALKKYDGLRLGRGLGEVSLPLFHQQAEMVERIHCADSALKMKSSWWLRSNAVEGLRRVLSRVGEQFDFESSVLIVGAGAAARVAISALFTLGFNKFSISGVDKKSVEKMALSLQRTHLGAKLTVVPREELILLPGEHGVFVNTTPMNEDNPMLEELYYFNFFKQGGVAVDFSILPIDTLLLKGAREIGATCICGYQISAQTDLIWCEQVLGRTVDGQNYEQRLGDFLRTVKV